MAIWVDMRTIDESYPEYLRTHQDEYAHLIFNEEKQSVKMLRHFKRSIRKIGEKLIRGIKKVKRILLKK